MGERFPLLCLFPLRLLVGVMLVLAGYHKFLDGWLHGTALMRSSTGGCGTTRATTSSCRWLTPRARTPKIFGALVTMGEMVIGAAMVVGLFTRFGVDPGHADLLHVRVRVGRAPGAAGPAMLVGAIFFTFLFAPPGRVLGLDHALRAKLPAWLA